MSWLTRTARGWWLIGSAGVLMGCVASTPAPSAESQAQSARPAADVARDAGRQPYAVLEFLGVAPGMTVLDVMAGGGYYTAVLAEAVGPGGRVYAQNTARGLRYGGGRNDRALQARLDGGALPNVRRLDREFDDLGLVADSVDVAITALNFHDVYHASPQAAQAVLAALYRVLKSGGVLGIIDHVGIAQEDNPALHRIVPARVIEAAQQAGFTVQSSDLLANADDDHLQSPFAPGLRGNTDRLLLKLTKP